LFDKCKMMKAKLTQAEISGASFEGSNVDQAELDYQGFIQYGQSKGFKLCT